MAAAAAVSVQGLADAQKTQLSHLLDNINTAEETLSEVAWLIERAHDSQGVERARKSHERVLQLTALIQARCKGLEELPAAHKAPAEGQSTDFESLLQGLAAPHVEACKQLEEITEARRQLEYGIWDVHRQGPEPGAAGDQDLDSDEDIAVANNNALAPNMFCPLTLKELLEIEDPVMDEKGYVYEKTAIVDYIRAQPRATASTMRPCPVAGTTHQVSERGLKPANKVLKAKRRQARGLGPRSQKPVQDSVVLDDEDAEVQGQDEDIEEVL